MCQILASFNIIYYEKSLRTFKTNTPTPCPFHPNLTSVIDAFALGNHFYTNVAHLEDAFAVNNFDFVAFSQGQMLKVQSERSIQKSNFDAKKQTKIIIHGFIDTPLASWVKVSVNFFIQNELTLLPFVGCVHSCILIFFFLSSNFSSKFLIPSLVSTFFLSFSSYLVGNEKRIPETCGLECDCSGLGWWLFAIVHTGHS